MNYDNSYLSKYLDRKDPTNNLDIFMKKFEEQYPGSKIIYLTETGSVLHGTNSDISDLDIKGIYIPRIESHLLEENIKVINLGNDDNEKNNPEDIDLEVYPVAMFLDKLSTKMETNSLEILFSMFSDKIIYETEESNLIKDSYKSLLFNQTEALTGFAIQMAARYSVKGDRLQEVEEAINFFESFKLSKSKLKSTQIKDIDLEPLLKDKEYILMAYVKNNENIDIEHLSILSRKFTLNVKIGFLLNGLRSIKDSYGNRVEQSKNKDGSVNYKAFAHAIRAIRQSKDLITNGFIQFPLPYSEYLKTIKYSKTMTVEELSNLMEEEKEELDNLKECSVLPYTADFDFINQLKIKLYKL